MNPLTIATTMARRGMLTPGPPVQQVKQLTALKSWGFGLAGELRQAANRSPKAVAIIDELENPQHLNKRFVVSN